MSPPTQSLLGCHIGHTQTGQSGGGGTGEMGEDQTSVSKFEGGRGSWVSGLCKGATSRYDVQSQP